MDEQRGAANAEKTTPLGGGSPVVASPVGRSRHEKWRLIGPWLIGLLAVGGIALTLSAGFFGDPVPVLELEVSGRLAVLPVVTDGARGEGWLSWGLAALIHEGLAANDPIQAVRIDRLYDVLAERELADAVTERQRQRQLARALGAQTVLDIVHQPAGDRVALVLEVSRPGEAAGRQRFEGGDALEACSRLVAAVADAMLAGGASVPLDEVLSDDAFARRLYGEGVEQTLSAGAAAGRRYFEIALRHRPDFFLARLRLADVLRRLGDLEPARAIAEELLTQTQSRGQRVGQARAYRALGLISAVDGDAAVAAEHYRQALRLEIQRDAPLAQADAIGAQAQLALASGYPDKAQELFAEVLQLRQQAGDRLGQIDALVRLSSLAIRRGELPAADNLLRDARAMAQDLSDVWEERRIAASLGEVAWRQGDAATAADEWEQALTFYRRRGDVSRQLLLSRNLARARAATGDLEAAEDLTHEQLELANGENRPALEADAALRLALLQLRQGYPSQAKLHLDRALELDGHLAERSELQRAIAWMAYEQGHFELAVSTQQKLPRSAEGKLSDYDASFLAVFRRARAAGRRMPLPHEAGYEPAAGVAAAVDQPS